MSNFFVIDQVPGAQLCIATTIHASVDHTQMHCNTEFVCQWLCHMSVFCISFVYSMKCKSRVSRLTERASNTNLITNQNRYELLTNEFLFPHFLLAAQLPGRSAEEVHAQPASVSAIAARGWRRQTPSHIT